MRITKFKSILVPTLNFEPMISQTKNNALLGRFFLPIIKVLPSICKNNQAKSTRMNVNLKPISNIKAKVGFHNWKENIYCL